MRGQWIVVILVSLVVAVSSADGQPHSSTDDLQDEIAKLRLELAECKLKASTADRRLRKAEEIEQRTRGAADLLARAEAAEQRATQLQERLAVVSNERDALLSQVSHLTQLFEWIQSLPSRFDESEVRSFTSRMRLILTEEEQSALEPTLRALEAASQRRKPKGNDPNQVARSEWTVFETTNIDGTVEQIKLGTIFKTMSGSIYEVTGAVLLLELELNPLVTVLSNGNDYRLLIDGVNEWLPCRRVAGAVPNNAGGAVIESRIDSDFDGFEHGKLFKLQNGQVWEQVTYKIKIAIRVYPRVTIWRDRAGWKMHVDGVDEVVGVRLLQ